MYGYLKVFIITTKKSLSYKNKRRVNHLFFIRNNEPKIPNFKLEFCLVLHAIQRGAKKYHFSVNIACNTKQNSGLYCCNTKREITVCLHI
jgi:hypothetical protein